MPQIDMWHSIHGGHARANEQAFERRHRHNGWRRTPPAPDLPDPITDPDPITEPVQSTGDIQEA